jgi:hypothetical protein
MSEHARLRGKEMATAVWSAIVTLATVGYGDVPHTAGAASSAALLRPSVDSGDPATEGDGDGRCPADWAAPP